jgi:hypothetical protein
MGIAGSFGRIAIRRGPTSTRRRKDVAVIFMPSAAEKRRALSRLRINCRTSVALGTVAPAPGAKVATRCRVGVVVMLFARHSCTYIDTIRRGLMLSESAAIELCVRTFLGILIRSICWFTRVSWNCSSGGNGGPLRMCTTGDGNG